MMDRPLLTAAQVAAQLNVTAETVIRWAKDGRLESVRTPGGRWRFRAEDVEALIASAPETTAAKS